MFFEGVAQFVGLCRLCREMVLFQRNFGLKDQNFSTPWHEEFDAR